MPVSHRRAQHPPPPVWKPGDPPEVEDAEAKEWATPSPRQKRSELRLQQITGLIGHVSGKPETVAPRPLCPVEHDLERLGISRGQKSARSGEAKLPTGRVVADQNLAPNIDGHRV